MDMIDSSNAGWYKEIDQWRDKYNKLREDCAALEQELKEKHKRQLKQTMLGVDDYCKQYDDAFSRVEQERDALKAYCEELKNCLRVTAYELCHYIDNKNAQLMAGVVGTDLQPPDLHDHQTVSESFELLNKSPSTCLKEHDAGVVESFLERHAPLLEPMNAEDAEKYHCEHSIELDRYRLHKLAQQLREEGK